LLLGKTPLPLSNKLADVMLAHPCARCGHLLRRLGSWFMTAANYRCENCGAANRITYPQKVRLFEANAAGDE
jgi:hypothetical protein